MAVRGAGATADVTIQSRDVSRRPRKGSLGSSRHDVGRLHLAGWPIASNGMRIDQWNFYFSEYIKNGSVLDLL